MLKRDELRDPNSCLNKAADDEMLFVFRATDKLAPHFIRMWAATVEFVRGTSRKVMEARACADIMEEHPDRKFPD